MSKQYKLRCLFCGLGPRRFEKRFCDILCADAHDTIISVYAFVKKRKRMSGVIVSEKTITKLLQKGYPWMEKGDEAFEKSVKKQT